MALSLTAEQKSVVKIFNSVSTYSIPSYQRSYSWDADKCSVLWDDLEYALECSKKDGYFIGNIVIAKSDDSDTLDVVDGQQSLITLTLLLKALSFFDSQNEDIKESLWRQDRRNKEKQTQVVKSYVFENDDNAILLKYLGLEDVNKILNEANQNRFATNFKFFYEKLEEFVKNKNIGEFSDFLLDKVYLLPIVARDEDEAKANEKALMIFETVNNRGLELSDADIFKAQLYNSALNDVNQDSFIKEWLNLTQYCKQIDVSTAELFRMYMHIIRGRNNEIGNEIGLRTFFTKTHPLKKKNYEEVLEDLYKIAFSLNFYNLSVKNEIKNKLIVKFSQVLSEYTIQYVKYTIVTYLFINSSVVDDQIVLDDEDGYESFLKQLTRFAYFYGSTTKTKFKFYEIIVTLVEKKEYLFNPPYKRDYDMLGSLKNGYILLTNYLDKNQEVIYPYYFDKIIFPSDIATLDVNWKNKEYYSYGETLGNLLLIDFTKKRRTLEKRAKFYYDSHVNETKKISQEFEEWTYKKYKQRDKELVEKVKSFIEGNYE